MIPSEFVRGIDLVTNRAIRKIQCAKTRIEVTALLNKYIEPSGIFNKLKVPDDLNSIKHIKTAIFSIKSNALRKIIAITKKELEVLNVNQQC